MTIEKTAPISEGKSKILFGTTQDENTIIQHFKDDATAFNGLKKGQIVGKGEVNNAITTWFYQYLEKEGIPTHFVEKLNEREMVVKKVKILPVEVVVRNIAAGSICKRLGVEKKLPLDPPLVEFFLKDDALGDPLITERHILRFGWANEQQLKEMEEKTLKVNELLSMVLSEVGITLVDFKLEFGTDKDGNLLLADEFTPDGSRLWDKKTQEVLDKDRFRQDMGRVEESYQIVYNKLKDFFEGKN